MRQEGYYWIKRPDNIKYEIAYFEIHKKLTGISGSWYLIGTDSCFYDEDFEKINENRIKELD